MSPYTMPIAVSTSCQELAFFSMVMGLVQSIRDIGSMSALSKIEQGRAIYEYMPQ
jgi:hypothetical protein